MTDATPTVTEAPAAYPVAAPSLGGGWWILRDSVVSGTWHQRQYPLETMNDTGGARDYLDEGIERRVYAILRVGSDERFDEESDSNLARRARHCLTQYGETLVRKLPELLSQADVPAAAVAEFVAELGNVEDPDTYDLRLSLLVAYLGDPSSTVRYGAVRGLMEMGDPRAKRALLARAAVERNRLTRDALSAASGELSRA